MKYAVCFDYSKLEGIIVEKYGTRRDFAAELGVAASRLSMMLKNKVCWKQDEIDFACKLLGIENDHIHFYFFTHKVVK